MNGWIKLHRSLLDWEWYGDINCRIVFLHLLLVSNMKAKKWRGLNLPAGSYVTSYSILAEECGISVRSLRTVLSKLKTTSEVTSKTTNKGTVTQVVNWDKYQQATSTTTNDRQSNDNQTTTIKEGKKEKNNDVDVVAEFLTQEAQNEALRMKHRMSEDRVFDYRLEQFKTHAISRDVKHKNVQDFRRHFDSWLTKQAELIPATDINRGQL